MKRTFCIKITVFSLLIMLSSAVFAETFRVSKLHVAEISQTTDSEANARVGINDSLAVKLPEDRSFIIGIEVKIDIPESVASWMDSVAFSVYENVNPFPSENQIDYSGSRVFVNTLPNRLSWILQFPLTTDNQIKANKYTTKVDRVMNLNQGFLFLRFQPVMKGVPEETLKAIIPVTVKPILANKGRLNINVKAEGNNSPVYTLFIDDKPADSSKKALILESGIHNISVISDSYRNELRTVRVDQAKTSEITIELKSVEPTLVINAPEGTQIHIDGEKCTSIGKEFVISEGEHKIRFKFGDYESVRTLTINRGKTYTANFSVDLQITEE